jgi:hypothetical protein
MHNSNNLRETQVLLASSGSWSCKGRTNKIKTIVIATIIMRIIYQFKSASIGRSQRRHRFSAKTTTIVIMLIIYMAYRWLHCSWVTAISTTISPSSSMEVHSIPARSYLKYKRMHCCLQWNKLILDKIGTSKHLDCYRSPRTIRLIVMCLISPCDHRSHRCRTLTAHRSRSLKILRKVNCKWWRIRLNEWHWIMLIKVMMYLRREVVIIIWVVRKSKLQG